MSLDPLARLGSSLNRSLQGEMSCYDNPDPSRVSLLAEKGILSPGTLYQQGGDVFVMGMGGNQHMLSENDMRMKFRVKDSNGKKRH